MSRHPTPQWCVQEKQGQHSRDESFSQIAVRVHSSPSAKLASGERLGLPCIGVDGLELERARAARLHRKHMMESCVFLTAKNMEKGYWQLSRGWLMVKCSLFLASSPRSYFKTYCWWKTTTNKLLARIRLTQYSPMWCWNVTRELCLCFCLCNLCPVLYNYLAVYSPQSWILAFNLSLWMQHWLYCPLRGPAEHLY